MTVLHRIFDEHALFDEPHKGFLLEALKHAPAGERDLSIWAARVLHRELLPFSIARNVGDPEGLLLLEADPQGRALNLAAVRMRPGSSLFPAMLTELLALARRMGFQRLEGRSRRWGMGRHLARYGWVLLSRAEDQPADFERYGYFGPRPILSWTPPVIERLPARWRSPEPPTLADLPEGFPFFRGDEP